MEQVHERVRALTNLFAVSDLFIRSLRYEKKVQEHNFGSLLRKDVNGEYTEQNTIFGRLLSFRNLYLTYNFIQ